MADEKETKTDEPDEEGVTVEVAALRDKPGKPELSDEEVEKLDSLPPDDEIGRYAKDAQKRIKSLHIANQEWRRRVVQSTRDVATATNLAQQLYHENQQLKTSTQRSEHALIEQALQRADAQLAQAKSHFLSARNNSDTAQELAAQEEIAQAVSERDRLRLLRPAPVRDGEPGAAPAAQPAAAAPVSGQPPQVSEARQNWIRRNPWFEQAGRRKDDAASRWACTSRSNGRGSPKTPTPRNTGARLIARCARPSRSLRREGQGQGEARERKPPGGGSWCHAHQRDGGVQARPAPRRAHRKPSFARALARSY